MAVMSDLAHSLLASAALGLLGAGLVAQSAAAADTDWRDVESRIQYAWYTEDTRDLANVADRVTGLSSSDPLRNYYLALTQLHEAQLALAAAAARDGAVRPAAVGPAAGACISSADEALAARPTDAEVLALQSLCMELRSQARSLDVPFAGSRGRAQMQRALQLAPRNPRVRLLAAQLSYAAARSNQERAELLGTFQSAVDAFELERQGQERVPAWGGAEAWQGLAQIYLDRGDAIAARAALEHALLLVPDYTSAHRLLNHILTG
jgi:tetratricopeptide (TPR) repeat protein